MNKNLTFRVVIVMIIKQANPTKKLFITILFMATICSMAQPLRAQQLRLGIFKFAPWGVSEGNKISGIIWEYYQAMLKDANLDANITLLPYPRMIKQLIDGKLDCAIFTKNLEPFQDIAYLYDLTTVAISRKGTHITKYDDFKNKSVGFANGTNRIYPKLFNDPEIPHHILPSLHQAPQMLARKRVDIVIGMKYTMLYEFRQQELMNITNIPWYEIKKVPVWLQCGNQIEVNSATITRLKAAALKLKANGLFEEIIKKWLSSDVQPNHQH